MDLPGFTADGVLPAACYELTLGELRASLLVVGPTPKPATWDAAWRGKLVDNLEILARQLWGVGITDIFIDGSFVEDKDHPNDIDGYFVCDPNRHATGELERELNAIDPHRIWTWDWRTRRRYRGYPKGQLPMWHQYRVELYPHWARLMSGIRDPHGNELEFPAAFRLTRDGRPKGVVKLGGRP
jgi:hypothetical protein